MKKWKVNLKKTMKEQDLRDKCKLVLTDYDWDFSNLEESINKCIQIAKDYAEKESIEFGQWMHENTVYSGNGEYSVLNVKDYKTLTECYQLFKNRENER